MQDASIPIPAAGGQNPPAEIFTDESAAAYIGNIEPRTVRSFRMSRGLPYLKLTAKTIRIKRSDLDRWLQQHRVAVTRGAQ
jgi:hypothetical protein